MYLMWCEINHIIIIIYAYIAYLFLVHASLDPVYSTEVGIIMLFACSYRYTHT